MPIDDSRQRAAETKRRRSMAALTDAARQAFSLHGWVDTRMEAVAREAGVSLATAYNHFPSKAQLIGAVYAPVLAPTIAAASDLLVCFGSPLDAVQAHVHALASRAREEERLTIAFAAASLDATAARGGAPPSDGDRDDPRTWVPLPAGIALLLQAALRDGLVRRHPSVNDAATTAANLLLLRMHNRRGESAEASAEVVLEFLLGCLAPTLLVEAGGDHRPFRRAPSGQKGA